MSSPSAAPEISLPTARRATRHDRVLLDELHREDVGTGELIVASRGYHDHLRLAAAAGPAGQPAQSQP